jgi:hypothetical protein
MLLQSRDTLMVAGTETGIGNASQVNCQIACLAFSTSRISLRIHHHGYGLLSISERVVTGTFLAYQCSDRMRDASISRGA